MTTTSASLHQDAPDASAAFALAEARPSVELRCERTRRGPYTAGGALLRHLVPELMQADRPSVARHSLAIVSVAPDLAETAPRAPQTLTNLAKGDERTRLYSSERTRNLAYDVSELVRAWIVACHPQGVRLVFHGTQQADPTDIELISTLTRRCPAGTVIVDPAAPTAFVDDAREPARSVVESDGTCRDRRALAAYDALDAVQRRALHDERARVLGEVGHPGDHLGALPYHLERGDDAAGKGVDALLTAVVECFHSGFYDAVVDVAERGRALTGAMVRPDAHSVFTNKLISSLMFLGLTQESEAVVHEQRRSTVDIADQMRCSYALAMIYTRYLPADKKDHQVALAWANEAVALADGQPDLRRRGFFRAFTRNAKALVVMHLGDFQQSLDLIDEAMSVADASLGRGVHHLHRTVLVHNRARVLVALRRYEEAILSFGEVVARDPEYDEPYFDRALAYQAMGRPDLAHADLDRAIDLGTAFLEARYNRANILSELGDVEAAVRDLDAVLDINPGHLDGLLNRAALHLGEGDLRSAEADISHGLAAAPKHASFWSAKGLLEAERGALGSAKAAYDRALALDPRLVEALGNRAILSFGAGALTDAVADLTSALDVTESPQLRVNRAVAWQALGDHDAALADLDAALGLADADAEEIEALRRQSLALRSGGSPSADATPGG